MLEITHKTHKFQIYTKTEKAQYRIDAENAEIAMRIGTDDWADYDNNDSAMEIEIGAALKAGIPHGQSFYIIKV